MGNPWKNEKIVKFAFGENAFPKEKVIKSPFITKFGGGKVKGNTVHETRRKAKKLSNLKEEA